MNDEPTGTEHPRGVRSFVRRTGRITPAQRRALERLMPVYGLECAGRPLDLEAAFGGRRPVTLEIGFGNGEALLAQARSHPERGYLGIEVHTPGVGRVLAALEREGLANVRVIAQDAVVVLRDCLADASLAAVQVFFPDPWPKKRHHKRRLLRPALADLLARRMRPGAPLQLATDWEEYAEEMLALLDAHPAFENIAGEGRYAPRPAERPPTRFEQRGQDLGHAVRDLLYRRRDGGPG